MSLETELKVMGLQPTKKQIDRLLNIAIDEYRTQKISDFVIKNTDDKLHALLLSITMAKSLSEVMYMLEKSDCIKQNFKREFNNLKKQSDKVGKIFEMDSRKIPELHSAYITISDELSEIIYCSLDRMQEVNISKNEK